MARSVVEYSDFAGGLYGRRGAWRAPKNTYDSTNMLFYRTGELGVRPGVAEFTLTGKANGVVWALATNRIDTGSSTVMRVWYGQGAKVHMFNHLGPGAVTDSAASVTNTPGSGQITTLVMGDAAYFSHAVDGVFKVSGTGATLANQNAFAAVTGCGGMAIFGERMFAIGDGSTPANRLFYSAAGDYTSWDFTNNWIDVGDTDAITALSAQRTHLLVAKRSGFYVVTGTPTVNLGHRSVSQMQGPVVPSNGVSFRTSPVDDVLWYTHPITYSPAVFDGVSGRELDHLKPGDLHDGTNAATAPVVAHLGVRDRGAVLYVNDASDAILARINRAWGLHTFDVDLANFAAPYSHTVGTVSAPSLIQSTAAVCLTDGGASGANPKFYAWSPLLDRPGLESAQGGSIHERAGDASTTQVSGSVSFPEWHTPDGGEVQVRTVVVDFRSWHTGGSNTNHFDVTVDALRRFDSTSPNSSATQSWNQTSSSSSTTGTLQRQVFGFGDQGSGNGFQVSLANVRGVAVQRIQVIVDSTPPRFG